MSRAPSRRRAGDDRARARHAQVAPDRVRSRCPAPSLSQGRDAYLVNRIEQAFVERYLERIIGRMIDVNYHLITGAGHAPPSDYFASFVRLGDLGVLDVSFARAIARAAGLRNRLVHEYEEIAPSRVFQALDEAMRDIPAYLAAVHQHLGQQP